MTTTTAATLTRDNGGIDSFCFMPRGNGTVDVQDRGEDGDGSVETMTVVEARADWRELVGQGFRRDA